MPALDGYTVDDNPIIGVHGASPRVVVLCGFSGHGFKLAPVMGQIAADLVLTGGSGQLIDELKLERFDVSSQRSSI